MIGQTLAHFEITAKLGEGGMGEVYRATDGRLGREVAIKVLPEIFVTDAERLARFEREAQLLASLNHPNIGAIYGLEQDGDTRFLILELIEGDTVQALLRKGLSLERALDVAAQVAIALEAAHEQGVVHRDLKPANVIVTPGGAVKVLDFGLAKAWAPDAGDPHHSASPTLTAQMTQAGVILGTAAYMSPEQARGQEVDKRADIWSFGVLTFEMLTGQGLFGGDTVTDTLAAVVRAEPDWKSLPPRTPRRVREVLERCLEKESSRRLRDIGEARIVLESAEPEEEVHSEGTLPLPARYAWAPWAVAVVLALALAAALWRSSVAPPEVLRLQAELAPGDVRLASDGDNTAFSPDGRSVAFIGTDEEGQALFLRELGSLEARRYSGTGGAVQPFFSRDGEWIGFFADGSLKKVSVRGGAPVTLVEGTRLSRGASWGTDGYVYYTPHTTAGIWRVPDDGGEPEQVTSPLEGAERSHRFPQILPSGERFVMTVQPLHPNFDRAQIDLVEIATGERKELHRGGTYGRYLASGHLIFVREGTLYALPFEPSTGEVLGQPTPVLEGVRYSVGGGYAHLTVSPRGTLIYTPGTGWGLTTRELTRLTLDGQMFPLSKATDGLSTAVYSPEGQRLAITLYDESGAADIWIHDLERDVRTRLTFDDLNDFFPLWTLDGESLVFGSSRAGGESDLWLQRADGMSDAELLLEAPGFQAPQTWLEGGRVLMFTTSERGNFDLMLLDLETREVQAYLATEFREARAQASPEGRWIAYESDESGRDEIYVRPYPVAPGKWQVSSSGGEDPRWSPDGKSLYYLGSDGKVHAVEVTANGSSFRLGADRVLFDIEFARFIGSNWDVHPDGSFVVLTGEEAEDGSESLPVFVFHWFEELNRLVPLSK